MIRSIRAIFLLMAALVVAALISGSAIAADRLATTFQFTATEEAEIGANRGSVAQSITGLRLDYSHFAVGYQHETYDWGNIGRLPFGNRADAPWDTLHNLYATAEYSRMFDDRWGWFAFGGVGAKFEDTPGTPSVFGSGGLIYHSASGLLWRFGAGGAYHEVESMVYPVIDLKYAPRGTGQGDGTILSRFTFRIGFPETSIGYQFNETVFLRAGARIGGGIYSLADDSIVLPDGFLQQYEIRAGLDLVLTPSDNTGVQLSIFQAFERQWAFYDRNANHLATFDLENALGGSIQFQYTF